MLVSYNDKLKVLTIKFEHKNEKRALYLLSITKLKIKELIEKEHPNYTEATKNQIINVLYKIYWELTDIYGNLK